MLFGTLHAVLGISDSILFRLSPIVCDSPTTLTFFVWQQEGHSVFKTCVIFC